jgi:uncharacterized protein YeaO (DUF488 family)
MTSNTYNSLVQRCADLCKKWNLNPLIDIWTHQEIVGWKDCHRWFVNNPNEWTKFKQKVKDNLNNRIPTIPATWRMIAMEFLIRYQFISKSANHDPMKALTFELFSFMWNNVTTKFNPIGDVIPYLESQKLILPNGNHTKNTVITWGIFGYTMANHFKERTNNPVQYLVDKKLILGVYGKENNVNMCLSDFGAVMMNFYARYKF